MSETWLKPNVPDSFVDLLGYRIIRLDRVGRGGGGIGVYVRDGFDANILATSPNNYCGQPEYMILSVNTAGCSPFLLALVYRPPKLGHLALFQADFERLHPSFPAAAIVGDFNIDLNRSAFDADFLSDFCMSNHLFLVPFADTHHTGSSHTRIDHCMISDQSLLISFLQQSLSFLSAHDMLDVTLDIQFHRSPPRLIQVRDYSRFDSALFCNALSLYDWSALGSAGSLDELVEVFSHSLISTRNALAPLRTFRARRPPAPWLTASIRSLMRRRDASRRVCRLHPSPARWSAFRSLRNLVQNEMEKAKNAFLLNRLSSISSPARLWSELRSLGLAKPLSSNASCNISPDELNLFFSSSHSSLLPISSASNSKTSSPPTFINSHFPPIQPLSSCSEPSRSFPADSTQIPDSPMSSLSDPSTFYFLHITPYDLHKALLKCTSNCAGPDGISRRLLLDSLPITFPIILDLLNQSLTSSTFPTPWKSSHIIPLPKTKNPSLPSHFRPISLLCYLSKILERIVFDQLSFHLHHHLLLDPLQTGFKPGNSTQTALIKLTDDIRLAIDKRMVTLLILFDFSKAFDSVNHNLLYDKLIKHRISAASVAWFRSYLSERSQRVRGSDGSYSSSTPTVAGVPQGSVLGPLLFAIFIDDLGQSLKHCYHILYADDLQIYYHFPPSGLEAAMALVGEDVPAVERWASANLLSLNANKTKAMLLGSARYVSDISAAQTIDLRVGGIPIELSNHVTNLGVHMTSTLNWSEQVSAIANKVNGSLWRLKYRKNCLPVSLRARLVSSLIFPFFDYCSAVFPDLTGQSKLRLSRLLNSCVRFIFDLRKDEHISGWYDRLDWLRSDDRRTFLICCLVYSVLNTGTPCYIACNLRPKPNPRACSRASPHDLDIPSCRTVTLQRSFQHVASSLWNSLPIAIRQSNSLGSFKSSLFRHLRRRGPDRPA